MSVVREASHQKITPSLRSSNSADARADQHLTATETRIVRLTAEGLSCKEIAQMLHRSPRTIENHRTKLMKKLAVNNTAGLVRRACEMRLIEFQEGLK
jgi:DNA-binding NarL/FixJ family response regulator